MLKFLLIFELRGNKAYNKKFLGYVTRPVLFILKNKIPACRKKVLLLISLRNESSYLWAQIVTPFVSTKLFWLSCLLTETLRQNILIEYLEMT